MKKMYLVVFLASLLTACGTDTSSGNRANPVDPNNSHANNDVTYSVTNNPDSANPQPVTSEIQSPARLSLNITDAPLDDVARVVVTFVSVTLINEAIPQAQTFTFNTPRQVDLLALQGLQFETLLSEIEVEAGNYQEMRLVVDDTNMNSFVETDNGSVYPLKIPSGSSSGLKIKSAFSFAEDSGHAYTLDFDLNKSVVIAGASGKYELKPVLRLVENSQVGHIRGTVDSALLTSADCSDADIDTFNAVYIYQGFDITPADIFTQPNAANQPITTTLIQLDNQSGDYMFEAAYLPAGEYTLAFTCNANLDNPDTDDEVLFFNTQNVTVQINNILFL